ncbi:MAG: oxygen-independent coproporphyrinogen III oxidase [Pseudomonadota bacterium]
MPVAMHSFLPKLAQRSVPRYTSYPTAAEFGAGTGAREQSAALDAVRPGAPVSLYVHIPYCREICWYCGCNTGAVGRPGRLDAYLDALLAEARSVGVRMRGRITSVHFGGGSPNAVSPDQFRRLAQALRDSFNIAPDAEWAAELDPRGLDADMARALADGGITRASLGAQTFAPHIQVRINRIQPFRDVARAAADLRAAGIARLNLDLMYGLPAQSLNDIAATVSQALTLAPDRIAMFGYAHMPRMLPRQRMIDASLLPDAEARFWQSALAHDLLVDAGFQAIGFDHFARPDDAIAIAAREGRLRRNFQGFTDDACTTLVGLGASSISQFDDLLVQNEKNVGRYRMLALNGVPTGVRGIQRTADDRLRAELIERLLCDGSVDIAAVAAAHRRPVHAFFNARLALEDLAREGIVALDGWTVRILPEGRPYARLAAVVFDTYRTAPPTGFSRAV